MGTLTLTLPRALDATSGDLVVTWAPLGGGGGGGAMSPWYPSSWGLAAWTPPGWFGRPAIAGAVPWYPRVWGIAEWTPTHWFIRSVSTAGAVPWYPRAWGIAEWTPTGWFVRASGIAGTVPWYPAGWLSQDWAVAAWWPAAGSVTPASTLPRTIGDLGEYIMLKVGDTSHPITFLLVDATNHIDPVTGVTPTVTRSKNGGAYAGWAGTVTEVANGVYTATPAAGDVDTGGELALHITATGADPREERRQIANIDLYDTVRAGLTALPNAAAGANGGLPTGDGSGRVTVISNADKTGYALSTAGVQAIWDALTSALTTVGSVGKRLADNLDVVLSTRLASSSYTAPDNTTITAINAKTTNLPASPAAVGSAMVLDLTQAVPTSNTAQTVGDALNAARADGFGKWVKSGTSLVLYAANGTTVVRTFTLDDATAPTSRT